MVYLISRATFFPRYFLLNYYVYCNLAKNSTRTIWIINAKTNCSYYFLCKHNVIIGITFQNNSFNFRIKFLNVFFLVILVYLSVNYEILMIKYKRYFATITRWENTNAYTNYGFELLFFLMKIYGWGDHIMINNTNIVFCLFF